MGVWDDVIFQPRPDLPTPLRSSYICNTVMTDFIAWLSKFRFAIISLLISVELKLAPLWKISST
jgi:hypothetical protein